MQIYYHVRKLDKSPGIRVGIVVERDRQVIAHGTFVNTKVTCEKSPAAEAWALLRSWESARDCFFKNDSESLLLSGSAAYAPDGEKGTQAGLYLWIASKLTEEITGLKANDEDLHVSYKRISSANNLAAEVSKLSGEIGLVDVEVCYG